MESIAFFDIIKPNQIFYPIYINNEDIDYNNVFEEKSSLFGLTKKILLQLYQQWFYYNKNNKVFFIYDDTLDKYLLKINNTTAQELNYDFYHDVEFETSRSEDNLISTFINDVKIENEDPQDFFITFINKILIETLDYFNIFDFQPVLDKPNDFLKIVNTEKGRFLQDIDNIIKEKNISLIVQDYLKTFDLTEYKNFSINESFNEYEQYLLYSNKLKLNETVEYNLELFEDLEIIPWLYLAALRVDYDTNQKSLLKAIFMKYIKENIKFVLTQNIQKKIYNNYANKTHKEQEKIKCFNSFFLLGINQLICETCFNLMEYYYYMIAGDFNINNYNDGITKIYNEWNKDGNFFERQFNLNGNTITAKYSIEYFKLPTSFLFDMVHKFNLETSEEINTLIKSPLILSIINNYNRLYNQTKNNIKILENNVYVSKDNFNLVTQFLINEILLQNRAENYFEIINNIQNVDLNSINQDIIQINSESEYLNASKLILLWFILIYERIIISRVDKIRPHENFTKYYLKIINNKPIIHQITQEALHEIYNKILNIITKIQLKNLKLHHEVSLFIIFYWLFVNDFTKFEEKDIIDFQIFIEAIFILTPFKKNFNRTSFYDERDIIPNYNSYSDVISKIQPDFKTNLLQKYEISEENFTEIINFVLECFSNQSDKYLITQLIEKQIYDIDNSIKYQNGIINTDMVLNELFDESYMNNFNDNFMQKDGQTIINPNFAYELKQYTPNFPTYCISMITEFKNPSRQNRLLVNKENNLKKNIGRMFFDIEDIHKDGKHYYNDIIPYINMLIDDICESSAGTQEEIENMKNKCKKEFIITTNTASAHGISYHVYLPLSCNFKKLKKFLNLRKHELELVPNDKTKDNVYKYVDPLVYGKYVTHLRMPFYGKGNLKLEQPNKFDEFTSNSNIKELITMEEWLHIIQKLSQNDLYIKPEFNKNNLIYQILNENNLKQINELFRTALKQWTDICLKNLDLLDLNIIYKQRNLILLEMLKNLLTSNYTQTRILSDKKNIHVIYKIGTGLLNENFQSIIPSMMITNTQNCIPWKYKEDKTNREWLKYISNADGKYKNTTISNETLKLCNDSNLKQEIKHLEREFKNSDFEYYIKIED